MWLVLRPCLIVLGNKSPLAAAEHPDTPGTLPFRILERDEKDCDIQAFSGVPLRSEAQAKCTPELFVQCFHRRKPLLHACGKLELWRFGIVDPPSVLCLPFLKVQRDHWPSETGRDHIPPRIFKEMTKLDKQRQKLEELLAGVTTFNAKSKIEAIQALLEKYIPNVERMQTQLKRYSGAFTDTAAENKRLKAEVAALKGDKAELEKQLKAATTESIRKRLKTGKLQEDYEKARSILSRIPPEVLRYYTANTRPEPGKSTPNRTRKGEALE